MDLIKHFKEPTAYGDAEGRHFRDEAGRDIYLIEKVVSLLNEVKTPKQPIRCDVTDIDDPSLLKAAISTAIQAFLTQR